MLHNTLTGDDFVSLFDLFKRKNKVVLSEEALKWNKMWGLWAEERAESPYRELMTYHSEINNGGHWQYFTNVENVGNLQEEMSELEQILPAELWSNVQKAYGAYLMLDEPAESKTADKALDQCDDIFYEKEDEIINILKSYAAKLEL